jgi:hypothetical protein
VDRKGSIIYKDQQLRKYVIKGLRVTSDSSICLISENIRNQSILIFDDSIKSGGNIRRVLDSVLPLNPIQITVAAILCSEESFQKLNEEYPNVTFHIARIIKRADFVELHRKLINPYLEYVCLPIQRDHPILAIRFAKADATSLFDFFNVYGEVMSDGIETLDYVDRCKKTLRLNNNSIEEVSNIIKQMGFIDNDTDLSESLIIRMYWIEGTIEPTLLLQPMILQNIVHNDSISVEKMDYIIKAHILIKFLLNKIVLDSVDYETFDIIGFSFFLNKNDWWAHL